MPYEPLPSTPMTIECLCVTEARNEFLPWLIWNFSRQSHPQKRLLIVCGETDEVPACSTDVRIVRVPMGTSVPAKRNRALREATSEVVAWWDDDDWQHPERLKWSAAALRAGASYFGSRVAWFADLWGRGVSRYRSRSQVLFNSVAVPRSTALRVAFDETHARASDTLWMSALRSLERGPGISEEPLFFWLCHQENVSNPSRTKRFERPFTELLQQFGPRAWGDTTQQLEELRGRLRRQD